MFYVLKQEVLGIKGQAPPLFMLQSSQFKIQVLQSRRVFESPSTLTRIQKYTGLFYRKRIN